MVMIKSLILAGFMLTSVFVQRTTSTKPAMSTLQVESNCDFSLTSKEFRVHYSGLGEGFTSVSDPVHIKIYKKAEGESSYDEQVLSFRVDESLKTKPKAYQFALQNAGPGAYAVDVCSGQSEPLTCSGKNEALTTIPTPDKQEKVTCEKGKNVGGNWVPASNPLIELPFGGLTNEDLMKSNEFDEYETLMGGTTRASHSTNPKYRTEYNKLGLNSNPSYIGETFYVAVKYDLSQYKKLFRDTTIGDQEDQAHPYCERKYQMSAHAHLVDINTHEVKYRYKTTLVLSEAGKQLFVLQSNAKKVHVEIVKNGTKIDNGKYELWVNLCTTAKDEVESTICSDPIVTNFETNQQS